MQILKAEILSKVEKRIVSYAEIMLESIIDDESPRKFTEEEQQKLLIKISEGIATHIIDWGVLDCGDAMQHAGSTPNVINILTNTMERSSKN